MVGVGEASVEEIDAINILQAAFLAMRRAMAQLAVMPDLALVDGNQHPGLPMPCQLVIGGDGIHLSIAAASIVAKVVRDRLMYALAEIHPEYGWSTNVGYGTLSHRNALKRFGPTPHHRRSFAPVRECFEASL
jgi:ribonuclease HII